MQTHSEDNTVLARAHNHLIALELDTIRAVERGGRHMERVRNNLNEAFCLGLRVARFEGPEQSRQSPPVEEGIHGSRPMGQRVQWTGQSGMRIGIVVDVIKIGEIPSRERWPGFYRFDTELRSRQEISYVVEVDDGGETRHMWPMASLLNIVL